MKLSPEEKLRKNKIIAFCLLYPFLAATLLITARIDNGPLLSFITYFGPPVGAISFLPLEKSSWKSFSLICIGLLYIVLMLGPIFYFTLWAVCAFGVDCL